MENVSVSYYQNLKRYWRRRRYKRLHGSNHNNRRKIKITRLGNGKNNSPHREWKIRTKTKLCLMRLVSPIRLLAKFHDAYVDMMIKLAENVASKSSSAGAFVGKKVAKSKQISMVSCGEEVDGKLMLEIYKRLAATRQMSAY